MGLTPDEVRDLFDLVRTECGDGIPTTRELRLARLLSMARAEVTRVKAEIDYEANEPNVRDIVRGITIP